MTTPRFKALALPLLVLAMATAGCAGPGSSYEKITEISAEDALLRISGKTQDAASVSRVAFADPWEYEEYAAVDSAQMRLEMFYITTAADQTSVQYPYSLSRMIETWRYNAGKAKNWGPDGSARNPVGTIDYRRYTLAGSQACAAFQHAWDSPPDDRLYRPGRVIFGYVCAPNGKSLSDEAIEDMLTNIAIRGLTEPVRGEIPRQVAVELGKPVSVSDVSRVKALSIARGSPAGTNGNAEFPFEFVVRYHEDGDKFDG